jgi:hypothetical protein
MGIILDRGIVLRASRGMANAVPGIKTDRAHAREVEQAEPVGIRVFSAALIGDRVRIEESSFAAGKSYHGPARSPGAIAP